MKHWDKRERSTTGARSAGIMNILEGYANRTKNNRPNEGGFDYIDGMFGAWHTIEADISGSNWIKSLYDGSASSPRFELWWNEWPFRRMLSIRSEWSCWYTNAQGRLVFEQCVSRVWRSLQTYPRGVILHEQEVRWRKAQGFSTGGKHLQWRLKHYSPIVKATRVNTVPVKATYPRHTLSLFTIAGVEID